MTFDRTVADKRADVARPRVSRPATATTTDGRAGTMLGLQQSAGNAAVGHAVSAKPSQTTAASPASANPSATLQLGALWNDLVVLPLAHADERLTREKPDEEGALADVDFALRGIGSLKAATPAEDPNRARIEILEIRVLGLRDILQDARGQGKSRIQLEQQMIAWRAEAAALGPELKYRPRVNIDEADEAAGEATQTPSESRAPGPSASVPDAAPGATPATAEKPAEEAETVPQLWRELVVDYLWEGQKAMDKSASDAQWWFLHAANNSGYFANGTPVGDPNRLRQYRVFHGLAMLADLVSGRAGDVTGRLINAAEVAYDHADVLGKRLTGQPVEEAPSSAATGEPEFTWESEEKRPFVNDTELERP